jgi:hypothetical protein
MRRTNTQKVARELRKAQLKYECEWEEQINSSKPNAERLQALHEKLLDVELNFRCVHEVYRSNPEKRVAAAARRGISVYDPDADDVNPSNYAASEREVIDSMLILIPVLFQDREI